MAKRIRKKKENIVELTNERRKDFIAAYTDPTSTTFSNAKQSALAVGFGKKYATNILSRGNKWLLDIVRNHDIVDGALNNLKKHIEIITETPVMTAFGPYINKKTKKMLFQEDPKLLKIQQDASFFALEKLHPDYKKKDKFEAPPGSVDIKQIIIVAPNGNFVPYNQANREAVRSILVPPRV